MITDPVPRATARRVQYEASDAHLELPLPPAGPLQDATRVLGEALAGGERKDVGQAGARLLGCLAEFYAVPRPPLSVLGVRPHGVHEGRLSYELFGDYTLETQKIRVWMRTAIRGQVTSHRGLLNTLIHEFCHHLDVVQLGYPDTPHTRGFYTRIDRLYHHALGTPEEKRKPLVWIPSGRGWRIDWRKLR